MRTYQRVIIGSVVTVALIIMLAMFLGSGQRLASFSQPFTADSVLFQQAVVATTSTDGNSYYEERCIDVTPYYAEGYTNSGVDSYGCQLVNKAFEVSRFRAYTSSCYKCHFVVYPDSAYKICNGVGNLQLVGCGTGYECLDCVIYQTVIKGGLEKVLNYCTFAQNDLLVAESFAGGQSITKFSLRYPIKSFCRAHPSIITDDVTKTSVTSTNVPQDLIDGKSVSIGASQTLTVFYVIENNYMLPTLCDSSKNLALDVRANTTICKSTLGFTYLCSEGQFDALSGTCVVQPESKTLCAQGRYDVALGLCIYNPPLQVDCGSNDCFYSVDRDVCSCYTQDEFVCPSGYKFVEPDESECSVAGGTWLLCPQCPVDKICSSDICIPRCSVGQKCVWDSPLIQTCDDANATITANGECVIQGHSVVICPSGTTYNYETKLCEDKPDVNVFCPNETTLITNSLTGVKECISAPPVFHSCAEGLIYDAGKDACVEQVQAYDPINNDFIIYKEVYKGCSADSDCLAITGALACNVDTGFCQTPVYIKEPVNYSGVIITGFVAVIVVIVLLYFFKPKGGKRR